jgi:hypothetical protein
MWKNRQKTEKRSKGSGGSDKKCTLCEFFSSLGNHKIILENKLPTHTLTSILTDTHTHRQPLHSCIDKHHTYIQTNTLDSALLSHGSPIVGGKELHLGEFIDGINNNSNIYNTDTDTSSISRAAHSSSSHHGLVVMIMIILTFKWSRFRLFPSGHNFCTRFITLELPHAKITNSSNNGKRTLFLPLFAFNL